MSIPSGSSEDARSNCRIKPLSPTDQLRLRSLRLRALESDPGAFGSTFADESALPAEHWTARLTDSAIVYFVAHDGRSDLGLARFAEEGTDAGLHSMWVAPDHRGQRIGEALVKAVLAEACSRGYQRVYLQVVSTNGDAIRLYERCGFRRTGRTTTYSEPRSGVVEEEMTLDLDPCDAADPDPLPH